MVPDSTKDLLTIGYVAKSLDIPQHVLRYWESKFTELNPILQKNCRMYTHLDVCFIRGLQKLLHFDGMTMRAAQNILEEKGYDYIISLAGNEHSIKNFETVTDSNVKIQFLNNKYKIKRSVLNKINRSNVDKLREIRLRLEKIKDG